MARLNYYKLGLIILLLIIGSLFGIFWLVVSLLIMIGVFLTIHKCINRLSKGVLKGVLRFSLSAVTIFIACIFVRTFLFDMYRIPSNSMNATLEKNDRILLNKLVYGPRLPNSLRDIPWVNIWFSKEVFDNRRVSNLISNTKRLGGINVPKQGDIVVFNVFSRKKKNKLLRETLVKRCIAVAGDVIEMKDAEVRVNGIIYDNPKSVKDIYSIHLKDKKMFLEELKHIDPKFKILDESKPKIILLHSTLEDIEQISTLKSVETVTLYITPTNDKKWLLGKANNTLFTIDNMGAFKIPEKGMTIALNEYNYNVYKKTLRLYEGSGIKFTNNKFYLKDKEVFSYTFNRNYFFMMGDNRKYSIDSRMYGFIPEENIIGKVALIF